MEKFLNCIDKVFSFNTFVSWILIAAIALILTFLIKFLLGLITKKLRKIAEKTNTIWDDVLVDLLDGVKFIVLFFWLFYLGSHYFELPPFGAKVMEVVFVVLTAFQFIIWGFHLLTNWRKNVLSQKISQDPSSSGALGLMYRAIQAVFVLIIVMIALSNLNVDVGALFAGLGVGGIAIALAAQNVLGDVLASLSIVLDKPFRVGDLINVGAERGTVEYIGIKTTRLRSVTGEELIISNKNLLESRVQNFKRMQERRVIQRLNIEYNTSLEQIEAIPNWMKEIVEKSEKTRFDRCHLANLGASGIEYELSYYVQDNDYATYMTVHQGVLFKLMHKLKDENVHLAYPSQTIYLNQPKT